jgi:uncharacterized protein with PIN domain
VRIYAESSAVLAAVLGEPDGERARRIIASAELVATSELTLIECDRALHRAVALKKLPEGAAAERRALIAAASASWTLFAISDDIVERARQPFPAEPLRALVARAAIPGLTILTLDGRVRAAASAIGLPVQPVA